ncbi:MAG: flagellar basal body-associated protein FliL [Burkholderiaceae bacterium]|jgi:flagellar FliL protein|nr:flagellar basal body-associated protein FliL [Burkholderiaceae bacterium]
MATKKDAPATPAGEKKSKKTLVILVVLILVLLGAAGGGWFYWQKMRSGSEGGAAADAKKKKKDSVPVYSTLEAFTVNLQSEEHQLLQAVVVLHLSSKEEEDRLKLHMPLVRNRILLLLSSKKPEEITTVEGKKKLAQEVMEQVKIPLVSNDSPLEVRDVFFTQFIIQ